MRGGGGTAANAAHRRWYHSSRLEGGGVQLGRGWGPAGEGLGRGCKAVEGGLGGGLVVGRGRWGDCWRVPRNLQGRSMPCSQCLAAPIGAWCMWHCMWHCMASLTHAQGTGNIPHTPGAPAWQCPRPAQPAPCRAQLAAHACRAAEPTSWLQRPTLLRGLGGRGHQLGRAHPFPLEWLARLWPWNDDTRACKKNPSSRSSPWRTRH